MHREAVDGHGGGSCVEVLILDAAHVTAINGVGEIRTKARDIKEGSALADLLVGGEGDAELAMGAALGKEDLGGGRISATPALSSAPSRVVPSVVIRVSPLRSARKGKVETFITMPVAGRVTSRPS